MIWTRNAVGRWMISAATLWLGACIGGELDPPDCPKGDATCEGTEPASCICPDIYQPVCGENGKTYGNACEAKCAAQPVAYEGECKDPGEGCVCPAIYKPVCGADGKTYGNSCEAACAMTPVAHDGECGDAGSCGACKSNADCSGGNVCFPPTHECQPECAIACLVYDPVCGTDGKTYGCGEADAHCHGVEVASQGECAAQPCVCTKEYAPVCGSDGKTYGNACMARCAGVMIVHRGSCGATCQSDRDCPHGYCNQGVTCAAIGCPPPPPNVCTRCGDGSDLLCDALPAPCPDGQVREIVNGCFGACVDRYTCASVGGGCVYDGKMYSPGASFPSSDGCNTCSCTQGGLVACTLRACACDYTAPGRRWVARSAEQCRLVKFACSMGEQPFFDPCGCGCEPADAGE